MQKMTWDGLLKIQHRKKFELKRGNRVVIYEDRKVDKNSFTRRQKRVEKIIRLAFRDQFSKAERLLQRMASIWGPNKARVVYVSTILDCCKMMSMTEKEEIN